jgi:hypothetical protein
MATWNPNVTWADVHVGDFNGDGFSDIVGRWNQAGKWYVGFSNGSTAFTTQNMGSWDPSLTWTNVLVGEFGRTSGRLAPARTSGSSGNFIARTASGTSGTATGAATFGTSTFSGSAIDFSELGVSDPGIQGIRFASLPPDHSNALSDQDSSGTLWERSSNVLVGQLPSITNQGSARIVVTTLRQTHIDGTQILANLGFALIDEIQEE